MGLDRIRSIGGIKLALVAVVGLGVVVGGGLAAGVIGAPSVTGVDNGFGTVTENTTEITTDIHVRNPNPIGVTAGGVTADYEIRLNDIPMANGTKEGVALDRGNDTIATTTAMNNSRIPDWWVSHLRNGEQTTLTVHADVHSSLLGRSFEAPNVERGIDTSLIEAFNSTEDKPVNASSPVVPDPVVVIRETRGEWGSISESETEIRMAFDVYNPRSVPIAVSSIGYDIGMNGIEMGSGNTETSTVIPPRSEETINATFRLDNEHLDEWWVSHLQNDQVTTLTADFFLRIDLSEGGGETVEVPLDTMTRTIETDIFGEGGSDGEGGSGGDGGSDGASSDGGSTETDDNGTETETTTDTPGGPDTPAETETESDDGLLGSGTETTTETDTPTETETATNTPTETDTPTETTDDGGLL
ncbi:LEA14-like dessication related protein [Halopenitus malekzadehii]|uniref:LEA14-like dessication related protein n=1 Tax=Halopenitus malekzadehii TaxID=1267564 RepID=A0A1H6I7Z9_9EURY|nr:LEA type 2 family protein [Halopenitus malekzadehii]SEH42354.1 LEA14-like dessication related protein [Halopenitus malekzadehii]